jgi:RND family efflux transporter MFP subunit
MLEIYSPELLATQEEYLRAREARARFSASSLEEVRKGGEDLYEAARRRLDLLGFPAPALAELERTGQARRTVRLPSPASGFVFEKQVYEGARIEPETALFRIVDLSRVWLEAALYESDASSVGLGQAARVYLASDPAHPRGARVAYLYPALDPATRTLRVRFELANPGLTLKPGMFADVELTLSSLRQLTIPDSAVLATGERRVVFVATAPGRFEPREIVVGARTGGRTAVLSGLQAGDLVVVRANFLLDSESRLRSALAGRSGGSPRP